MNSIPAYSCCPSLRSLTRKKPFTFLALFLSIILLILACTTKNTACYDQLGSNSIKIGDKFDPYCASQCNGDLASKKIAFINDQQTAVISSEQFAGEDLTPGIQRVIKCGWTGPTGRLFLAFCCFVVVWTFLELLLTAKRKYPFILNITLIYGVCLGISLAIFQIRDIHNRTCSAITFANGSTSEKTFCYQSLFDSSFVLMIVVVALLLFQLIYNIVRRRSMNEEDREWVDTNENILLINNRSR